MGRVLKIKVIKVNGTECVDGNYVIINVREEKKYFVFYLQWVTDEIYF